jgi:16S rRNA (cytosine967-C5)-methyltransferase
MRPSARLQAAIDLLDEIIVSAREGGASADTIATKFFGMRRYAGSKDRRAIRDLAWRGIRHFGELPLHARSVFVAIADDDAEIAALFDGDGYGPAPILPDELRATGAAIPHWILPYFSPLIDADEQQALLERAPLDLRVNTLKATMQDVMAQLPEAVAVIQSRCALRLPTGFAADRHPILTQGLAEVQDLGSQLIVDACCAEPGMAVLDLCAGAGGKTLGLAAAMQGHSQGQGKLIASDTNRARLGQLIPRAQRAGAHNIETLLLNPGREREMLAKYANQCDVVLIDAPCSGSGTWRRSPETRWRLNQPRLQRVCEEQRKLLEIGADMVAPSGYLMYAVCSLLDAEGLAQIQQFLQSHPQWRVAEISVPAGRPHGDGILLSPKYDGSDGFFMARLQKL